MRKKSGFTLIEILIVIVIIGILFTIAVVSSSGSSKKLNQKIYEEKLDYILVAAKQFGESSKTSFVGECKHLDEVVSDAKCFNVTVQNLIDHNFITAEDAIDPRTNESMADVKIEVQNYYSRVHAVVYDGEGDKGGTVIINGGVSNTTTSLNVTLGITAFDPAVTEMCVSNTKSCKNWEEYRTIRDWKLENQAGERTVYVWFRDDLKNVSAPISSSIIYDPAALGGSIAINNNAPYTGKTAVNLKITTDATSMCISNTTSCTTWESVTATKSWNLTPNDGIKIVRAWFRDEDGSNFGEAYASIILETVPPTGSVSINGGAIYSTSNNVTLNLQATDNISGMEGMCISNTNTCTDWRPYAGGNLAWSLIPGDGSKTVYVWYRDRVENVSTVYTAPITVDGTPPATGSIVINGNAQYTISKTVSLTLSSSDNLTNVANMCISETPICTTWIPYSTTHSHTIGSTGDGTKTIYARFKDNAGNISESPVNDTIFLDATKPTCTLTGENSTWTRSPQTIVYGCSDGGSGCHPSYSGGSNQFTTTTQTTTIAAYTIRDKAGNQTNCPARTANVFIDTTPPQVSESYAGAMIYRDPTFASGTNGFVVYNNSGNGTVTHERVALPNPYGSYVMRIRTNGVSSPGLGGYAQLVNSKANAIYIGKIIAKIPIGYNIQRASNVTGTGSNVYWITSQAGTGNWQEYIYIHKAGSTGTFSSLGHVYLTGTGTTVTWDVAYATVIEDKAQTNNISLTFKGEDIHSGVTGYGINQSPTTPPTFKNVANSKTIGQEVSGITVAGTYYIWLKDALNNQGNTPIVITNVDTTKPTATTFSPTSRSWSTSNVTVNFTATDAESGIAYYQYCVTTGGSCTPSTNGASATISSDGSYNICSRAIDNSGNIGNTTCAGPYQVDKTPPTCTVTKSNTGTISGVTVTVVGNDPHSGIVSGNITETGVKTNKTYTVTNRAGLTGTCSVTVTAVTQYRSSTCSTYYSCQNAACGYDSCLTGSNTCVGGNKTCANAACGVASYKYCQHSECGWNACLTGANTCVGGYNSCRTSGCGVELYKYCQNSACGWNSCLTTTTSTSCSWSESSWFPYSCSGSYTSGNSGCASLGYSATYNGQQAYVCTGKVFCKNANNNYCWASNSACKCSSTTRYVRMTSCTASCTTNSTCVGGYNSCRTSGCGVELYKYCQNSACGWNSCLTGSNTCVGGNNSCRTPGCGVESYNTCQNAACGYDPCLTGSNTCVGGNKTCRTEACGCETWGAWSSWTTTVCSPSGNSRKCESRVIYN